MMAAALQFCDNIKAESLTASRSSSSSKNFSGASLKDDTPIMATHFMKVYIKLLSKTVTFLFRIFLRKVNNYNKQTCNKLYIVQNNLNYINLMFYFIDIIRKDTAS